MKMQKDDVERLLAKKVIPLIRRGVAFSASMQRGQEVHGAVQDLGNGIVRLAFGDDKCAPFYLELDRYEAARMAQAIVGVLEADDRRPRLSTEHGGDGSWEVWEVPGGEGKIRVRIEGPPRKKAVKAVYKRASHGKRGK